MDSEYQNNISNGYLISDIHSRADHLLDSDFYNLLTQCEALEDLIIKLSQTSYSKFLSKTSEIDSKKKLKIQLYKSLEDELIKIYKISDNDIKLLLDYFYETLRIQEFVLCLAMKIEGNLVVNEDNIGFFPALNTLKFCNDMTDVYKFCVCNSFLKEYYEKPEENEFLMVNLQLIHSKLSRNHQKKFYLQINNTMNHMRRILEFEGDRQIIELTINTIGQDIDRKLYFSSVNNLSENTIKRLSEVDNVEELTSILSDTVYSHILEDPLPNLQKIEINIHLDSFLIFNDISCIFSYLKLKEQEIKNILLITESMLSKRSEYLEHILVLKK